MTYYKRNLLLSLNYFKNKQLSKVDRFFNTSISKPPYVYLKITERCNSRCRHCHIRKAKNDTKELDTNQWKCIILKLKKWIGPFYLKISGGEPFLREDLFEIINFAHSKHIFTSVITNGSLLPIRFEELSKSNLSRLTISLDGVTAETHDFFRGSGSFKRIIPSINILKKENKRNLIVTINSVMSEQNFHELPALVKFVQNNKLQGIFFTALLWRMFYKKNFNRGFLDDPLWPKDYEKVKKILEELIQLKKKGYPIINSIKHFQLIKQYFKNPNIIKSQNITCSFPYEYLVLNPKGKIVLCYNHLTNSILKYDPSMIWKSKKVKQLKRKFLNCRIACLVSCGFFDDTIISNLSKVKIVLFGK